MNMEECGLYMGERRDKPLEIKGWISELRAYIETNWEEVEVRLLCTK